MTTLIGKLDLLTLGIASAGCFGAGPNKWGGQASSVSIYDTRLEAYYHRLVDGGTVIDKRPAFEKDHAAAVSGVVRGPMHNAQLPDNTVDSFMADSYTTETPDGLGSMDNVSTNLWCAFWVRLGARVGKRVGNTIVWDDGQIDAITVPEWANAVTR